MLLFQSQSCHLRSASLKAVEHDPNLLRCDDLIRGMLWNSTALTQWLPTLSLSARRKPPFFSPTSKNVQCLQQNAILATEALACRTPHLNETKWLLVHTEATKDVNYRRYDRRQWLFMHELDTLTYFKSAFRHSPEPRKLSNTQAAVFSRDLNRVPLNYGHTRFCCNILFSGKPSV